VVFASSAAASGFEQVALYDAIAAGKYDQVPREFARITRDVSWTKGSYGAAKVWGEALRRHFLDAHGLSILCVRIGRVNEANRPESIGELSRFLSHRNIFEGACSPL
jgi:nucleoside-diphosphate-sugar epimerase